jgi:alkanesulfonate monooxygenase SsuD/methylene tetrahydromethanopterin reductase-like flavin-dependent oxidoreductase (luciferase family)
VIWVGGHSRAALRRTARHGDGCHPVGVAASPLPPQEMRAHLDTLSQLTEAERRNFSTLTISYKAPLYDTAIPSPDGSRRLFSGESEQIAGDIRAFAAIGVHELIFRLYLSGYRRQRQRAGLVNFWNRARSRPRGAR